MTELQLDYWDKILSMISTLIVIIAAIAGAFKYFQERQRDRALRKEELAWRKTQFILELAENFEKDSQHQVVWRILAYGTGIPKNSTLGKILNLETNGLNDSELSIRYAIDDYLDFFDRLYHFTFVTQSLNFSDLEVFGWYIAEACKTKEIRDYAKVSGFEDVLELNAELRKVFGSKHWYKVVTKRHNTRRDGRKSAQVQVVS